MVSRARRGERVYYRVLSDSKIGLDVPLHDADDGEGHADEELIAVANVVNRLSFVVIRIRNTGGDGRRFRAPAQGAQGTAVALA